MFYLLIVTLQERTGKDYVGLMDRPESEACKVFRDIEANSASVEIVKDGHLQRVHFFCKHLACMSLGDEEKARFQERLGENIATQSPRERITGFLQVSKGIVADIEYLEWLLRVPIVRHLVTGQACWWLNAFLLCLTGLINLAVLINWRADMPASPYFASVWPSIRFKWFKPAMAALGVLHLLAAVLVATSHFSRHPPGTLRWLRRFSSRNGSFTDGIRDLLLSRVGQRAGAGKPRRIQVTGSSTNSESDASDASSRTRYPLFSVAALHHLFLCLFSALGFGFAGYFYSYHLFHVFLGQKHLSQVFRVLFQEQNRLLHTLAWLGVAIITVTYNFTFVQFAFLRGQMQEADGQRCSTLFEVRFSALHAGPVFLQLLPMIALALSRQQPGQPGRQCLHSYASACD